MRQTNSYSGSVRRRHWAVGAHSSHCALRSETPQVEVTSWRALCTPLRGSRDTAMRQKYKNNTTTCSRANAQQASTVGSRKYTQVHTPRPLITVYSIALPVLVRPRALLGSPPKMYTHPLLTPPRGREGPHLALCSGHPPFVRSLVQISKSPACSLLMLALSALSTAHSRASTDGAIKTCGRT